MSGQKGTVTVEGVRFGRLSGLVIHWMGIGRCLDRDPGLRHFPAVLNVEQTGVSGGDGVTCQRAPLGNPLNDEQWSDHLPDPSVALNSWHRDGHRGKART